MQFLDVQAQAFICIFTITITIKSEPTSFVTVTCHSLINNHLAFMHAHIHDTKVYTETIQLSVMCDGFSPVDSCGVLR